MGHVLHRRQIGWAAVSFIVLMHLKRLDYRRFDNPVWAFAPLGFVMSLLVLVYFVGCKHRWLNIGSLRLQPSEFAKPALIIFLAYFISCDSGPSTTSTRCGRRCWRWACGGHGGGSRSRDRDRACVDGGHSVLHRGSGAAVHPWTRSCWRLVADCVYRRRKPVSSRACDRQVRSGVIRSLIKINPSGEIRAYVKGRRQRPIPRYQPKQSRIAVGSGGVLGVD